MCLHTIDKKAKVPREGVGWKKFALYGKRLSGLHYTFTDQYLVDGKPLKPIDRFSISAYLPIGVWLTAVPEQIRDGAIRYKSGFHIYTDASLMPPVSAAYWYAVRKVKFRKGRVMGTQGNEYGPVVVADEMMILPNRKEVRKESAPKQKSAMPKKVPKVQSAASKSKSPKKAPKKQSLTMPSK